MEKRFSRTLRPDSRTFYEWSVVAALLSYPVSDVDLWSQDALLDPYPLWKQLREAGPVVLLNKYDFYALPRYAQMRAALADWQTFSSAQGVMLNPEINAAQAGATLHSDPPLHDLQREIVGRPLIPRELKALEEPLRLEAALLVDRLIERGTFDAAADLAPHLPLTVVSKQVGLPPEGRESMLAWAEAAFNSAGPLNERAGAALPTLKEGVAYSYDPELPSRLDPEGWAIRLWQAADRGEIAREKCPALLIDYWGPALDTTIAAITSAIWLFGRYPQQWRALREDRSLISHAINEVIRLESPTPYFTRVATRDVRIGEGEIPAGARVLMMYGSANRDEAKWSDAAEFNIRRAPSDHLGFGHGKHLCLGQQLARMEMRALLTELAERVERFELGRMERMVNNMLRQIRHLEVTVH
jgi:cytochrome P450